MKTLQIIGDLLDRETAVNGERIVHESGVDIFTAARAIHSMDGIHWVRPSKRYLRIDVSQPSHYRLSPSFAREFLTYSAFSRSFNEATRFAAQIMKDCEDISLAKLSIAKTLVKEFDGLFSDKANAYAIYVCGDLVHGMAHRGTREESSTGLPVRGSDIDLVIIVSDLDEALIPEMEDHLLGRKYFFLKHPCYREELDFVVKTMSVATRQFKFASTRDMIACKIYWEAELIAAKGGLALQFANLFDDSGIKEKLSRMFTSAERRRRVQEARFFQMKDAVAMKDATQLFLSAELDEFGELLQVQSKITLA